MIQFSTIVHNEGLQNQSGKIGIKIYSPAGNEVFSTSQDVILSEGTPVATSFSHIVNSGPHEITYYIRMLFYQVPVLGSFFRIRLTTIDHAIGIGSMIALIFPPDIIVACHIQILEDPVGIFVPTKLASVPEVIGTDGCETGCIVLADGIHQSFGNQVSLRFISTLLHLVTCLLYTSDAADD